MARLEKILAGFKPETALVLGSGLGGLVDAVDVKIRAPYADIDGFPESKVSGHTAELIAGTLSGHPVAVLSGRVHYYEAGDPAAMRGPLEALKDVGINRLILTNSAGSVDEDKAPGSVMQIEDHINFSGTNPLFGEPTDNRFVGMTSAYDQSLQSIFAAKAEAFRTFGANAVGMSTVPEVILARFLDMDVAAFSVITNYAAGMTGMELGHGETKEVAPKGGALLTRLISSVLKDGFE